jgi:hypothetical protein
MRVDKLEDNIHLFLEKIDDWRNSSAAVLWIRLLWIR